MPQRTKDAMIGLMTPIKIYFDGGCKPKPRRTRGHRANNGAEGLASLPALDLADAAGYSDLHIFGDSRSTINGASGRHRSPFVEPRQGRIAGKQR
jgi:ribonuclease HI